MKNKTNKKNDLISRQAAIDEAEEWIEIYYSGRGGQREQDAIKHVISGIKKLPSIQQWIPCSKQLPKKIGDYLVTDHNGQIARYIYLNTDASKEYWMRCVIAWMPLPQPYKEGRE